MMLAISIHRDVLKMTSGMKAILLKLIKWIMATTVKINNATNPLLPLFMIRFKVSAKTNERKITTN